LFPPGYDHRLRVSDFDFFLPPDLIAQDAGPRGESRLMALDRTTGVVHHAAVADLPRLLQPGDLLVVNDTRVFAARLLGHRVPSGGAVECLLLGPSTEEEHAMPASPATTPGSSDSKAAPPRTAVVYDALVHPGQKLKPGARMKFEGGGGVLIGEVLARRFHGRRRVRLWVESGGTLDDVVDRLGHVPLPPYIKRPDNPADRERYQTVFARVRGSVAAPTAGLHVSAPLLTTLAARGVEVVEITLHVGYGTFQPVRVDRVEAHRLDAERYEIGPETAARVNQALEERRRIVAVGTTTTRTLEAVAMANNGRLVAGRGVTDLFIYP